ncbi:MAG: ATP-binding protein [Desulfobacula sp.]|nr:ATP-binding protein [Desulfobacula sp.]
MFHWEKFLAQHRDLIIDEWQKRLQKEVSDHYAKRSQKELRATTGKACDAFSLALAKDDYAPINVFINEITQIRLDAGFPLADVQKAFELFRQIVIPLLIKESPPDLLCENIEAINKGLAYTIHRFSNHFQTMHETYLKEYAKRLEKDVAKRTAELKDSEQQYRSLVEEISDGYLALHKENIAFVNPAFCKMHDVEPGEILQKSFLEFVADENKANITRTVINGAEPEAFEYLRRKKDGSCLPTEINFKPSWFKGQEYHLCIVRDITKRVQMEKKSRELERMAYIGKLTTSLSHEIRNPLSSVKMNLQILGKNNSFKGNDKKRLDISEREIQRLEGILKELLDFAKPVALQSAKTDINQIIFSCVELLEVKIKKQHIHCEIRVDEDLPLVMADKGKVEQLVINLLLNALESVDESGKIIVVTTKRDLEDGSFVVIRVQDDGKGLSKQLAAQIFEPFYTTKTTGTGLGLANVKRIVAAHRGRVEVVTLKTPGTAFEVFLPMVENNG